jgi:hypothetical protein
VIGGGTNFLKMLSGADMIFQGCTAAAARKS